MMLSMGRSGFMYVPVYMPQPHILQDNFAQAFQRETEQTVESKPQFELSKQEAWGLVIGIALVFIVWIIMLGRTFKL